jgi:iron complex outermembrane receptor protein
MHHDMRARTGLAGAAGIRRTTFARRRLRRLAGACLALCSVQAAAQSIDYPALERLFGEPVTTSVTGSPQRASDVPAAMEIITADDIRRSGAKDLPGVLNHVAGLDVMQWTNDGADVGVRGYDQAVSPRLLVLIDGRQVYADFYGFTPWTALPVQLDEIRQIEVVKGPNSALFGFNAADGVINIITRSPLSEPVNRLSLSAGTQNLRQASAVGSFRLGDAAALRLSAGGGIDDEFGTPVPPAVAAPQRSRNNHGAFNLNGVVRLGQSAVLGLEASHSEAGLNQMGPEYQLNADYFHTNSVKLQLGADTRYGLVQALAYTNWITGDDAPPIFGSDFVFDNRVTVGQLQDIFKAGSRHTFRLAAEYRYNIDSTTPFSGADVFYRVCSGSGMWEWRLTPSLTLTNALRWDKLMLGRSGPTPPDYPYANAAWDHSRSKLSFNSGLVWRAGELDTLRLLIGRGVQVPNLIENGALLGVTSSASAPGSVSITGIPTLPLTVVTNYELGWDRALPFAGAQLRLSAFHQDTNDLVSLEGALVFGPQGSPWVTPANIGSSHASGLELELKSALDTHWRWGLSYRLERIGDSFDPVARNGADFLDFSDTAPKHQLKGNLGWSSGRWEADAYLHYQSRTLGLVAQPHVLGSTLVPLADYLSADARIGCRLNRRTTLSLSGQNLTRSTQRQTTAAPVERRVMGGVTFDFGKSGT